MNHLSSINQQDLLLTALEQPELLESIRIQAVGLLRNSTARMTVEDLTHVGWICAAEKVDNYDLEKGASIMTFLRNTATWGMRDHIKSQEVHNKYNPFDDSDGDEDFITHKDSSYHMSEFEESLDVITILELLDDEEAQEMLIMWMSGATYVAIGEEFGYEQSWTRRKIEGWVTHLKTKLHVDIEILKDETF